MGLQLASGSACTGCGALTINLTGAPQLGGQVTCTIGNLGGGIPFIGLGFGPFCIAQFCSTCIIGHSWVAPNFGSTITLGIPNNPVFVGTEVGFQGVGLNSPGGCQAPLAALSDTLVARIQ